MLDHKGFDLWANGYDRSVGLSEEENTYPFAGYKKLLSMIYKTILEKPNPVVLDIGFGTGTLTRKLYEHGCHIYGQDFSSRMIALLKKCRRPIFTKEILRMAWWNRSGKRTMISLWRLIPFIT